jgi:hypothetical protein
MSTAHSLLFVAPSLLLSAALASACGSVVTEDVRSIGSATTNPVTSAKGTVPSRDAGPAADAESDGGTCRLPERPNQARAPAKGVERPMDAGMKLTFVLRDNQLELTNIVSRGVAPVGRTDQVFEEGKTSGAWIEMRDPLGAIVFQNNLYDPLGTMLEAPTAGGGFTVASQCAKDGVSFFTDVPNGMSIADVRVYASGLIGWYMLPVRGSRRP